MPKRRVCREIRDGCWEPSAVGPPSATARAASSIRRRGCSRWASGACRARGSVTATLDPAPGACRATRSQPRRLRSGAPCSRRATQIRRLAPPAAPSGPPSCGGGRAGTAGRAGMAAWQSRDDYPWTRSGGRERVAVVERLRDSGATTRGATTRGATDAGVARPSGRLAGWRRQDQLRARLDNRSAAEPGIQRPYPPQRHPEVVRDAEQVVA